MKARHKNSQFEKCNRDILRELNAIMEGQRLRFFSGKCCAEARKGPWSSIKSEGYERQPPLFPFPAPPLLPNKLPARS